MVLCAIEAIAFRPRSCDICTSSRRLVPGYRASLCGTAGSAPSPRSIFTYFILAHGRRVCVCVAKVRGPVVGVTGPAEHQVALERRRHHRGRQSKQLCRNRWTACGRNSLWPLQQPCRAVPCPALPHTHTRTHTHTHIRTHAHMHLSLSHTHTHTRARARAPPPQRAPYGQFAVERGANPWPSRLGPRVCKAGRVLGVQSWSGAGVVMYSPPGLSARAWSVVGLLCCRSRSSSSSRCRAVSPTTTTRVSALCVHRACPCARTCICVCVCVCVCVRVWGGGGGDVGAC